MACNENDARWSGLGRIVVRSPSERDEVGTLAALARRVRGLFARPGEKALAKAEALRVEFDAAAKTLNETGEQKTMKDKNGNNAFVHIDGVTYVSAATVASSITDFGRAIGAESSASGQLVDGDHMHKWRVDDKGKFYVLSNHLKASFFTQSKDLPEVEAFLEKPKTQIGELTYKLTVDASSAFDVLEYLKAQVADTALAVEAEHRALDAERIEREVKRVLENESRQGGILWHLRGGHITHQGVSHHYHYNDAVQIQSANYSPESAPGAGDGAGWRLDKQAGTFEAFREGKASIKISGL